MPIVTNRTDSLRYCRTPLPTEAQFKLGWVFLCLAFLLASPFIGFALHGKVVEAGLVTGLGIAIIPLCGLVLLVVRNWMAWRRLAPEIAEEWRTGRIFPADGAPTVTAPVGFSNKNDSITVRADGVLVSQSTLLGFRSMPDAAAKNWLSQTIGECFVPWADVLEWEVCDDSDGPDFYRMMFRAKGHILIRRFAPIESSEAHLLDAIRSIGKLPVRMRCDLSDG